MNKKKYILSLPTENIRKPYGFLMLWRFRERVIAEKWLNAAYILNSSMLHYSKKKSRSLSFLSIWPIFLKVFLQNTFGRCFLKSTLLYSGNNCSILRAYLWTISSICSSTCYIFVLVIKVFFNSISLLKSFRNVY